MEIISHRGYWKTKQEKNTLEAFERSFELGFGTETDVRDFNGELVISHDIPTGNEITLLQFLKLVAGKNVSLALNIKADGLTQKISDALSLFDIKKAFVFDMSVPDQLGYYRHGGIEFFSRASEYEPVISLYKECHGVWLDAFESIWYDMDYIEALLRDGKKVCIVSPELHNRNNFKDLWSMLAHSNFINSENLILCTDLPEEAQNYFKVSL